MTAAALFFFLGILLLPYPGLQNDECLFTQPLYRAGGEPETLTVFHHDFPLMLMSYLGTSKTLLYKIVFKVSRPSVWSIRLPALFTGAVSIWMFGLLLFRLTGSWGAIVGSFLLALDPSYLLTSVFDWGPVALQHLLLIGGVLALVIFHSTDSRKMLGLGFAAFGLGMWDKALFSWMLAGLVLASLLFLAPQIRRRLTAGNVAWAIAGFVIGAAPLITYNLRNGLETFRGNTKLSAAEMWPKLRAMPRTLDGSGLLGYLIREEGDDSPRTPQTLVERASTAVHDLAGQTRQGWAWWFLLLVLMLAPWWWSGWRGMAFAAVTGLVAWLLMSATTGAGGAVHHVVLGWPVPQFLMAFGLATAVAGRGVWWERLALVLVVVVCVRNALVTNQYLYNAYRVGPGSSWTDAIFPLRETLETMKPEHVNMMDWGYEFNLLALTRGRMEIHWGAEAGEHETANENDEKLLKFHLELAPTSVWIKRVEAIEVTPGSEARFALRAKARGYDKQSLHFVNDRYGRQMFEIYRFVKVSP